jgi:hypothetical protein
MLKLEYFTKIKDVRRENNVITAYCQKHCKFLLCMKYKKLQLIICPFLDSHLTYF